MSVIPETKLWQVHQLLKQNDGLYVPGAQIAMWRSLCRQQRQSLKEVANAKKKKTFNQTSDMCLTDAEQAIFHTSYINY